MNKINSYSEPVCSDSEPVDWIHKERTEHSIEGQADAHNESEVVYLRPGFEQSYNNNTEITERIQITTTTKLQLNVLLPHAKQKLVPETGF